MYYLPVVYIYSAAFSCVIFFLSCCVWVLAFNILVFCSFFPSIPLWRTMTSLAGSCTHTRTHTIILLSLQEPHTQVYNTTPKQHRNVFGKWLWGSNCSDCRGFFSHLYSSKARNNYWVHYQLVCLMMLLFIVLSVNCKDTVKTLVLIFFNKKQWKIQIQSLLFF